MLDNMRVEVYKNLHKGCLSVRHKGKVIKHVDSISLQDVKFVVQPAGRAKVLSKKQKNVHAFARGTITKEELDLSEAVSYNPYKSDFFYRKSDDSAIYNAAFAVVTKDGIFV